MGLLQRALDTYNAMERLAGVYEEGREPLAPVGHIVTKAQIEISIDAEGSFLEARTLEDEKIILPVTEESSGRTSSPAAHALCEQLGYLLGDDKEKLALYTGGLRRWVESEHSHPKARAVLKYVEGGSLRADLKAAGISTAKEKSLVCWRVLGLGAESGPVWKDISLMKAYTAYYLAQRQGERQICMLTGKEDMITWQHLKGVFSLKGNAKLISANDTANFSYRGRFTEPEEAAAVGYIASQKAHNALKWLVSNQATVQGRKTKREQPAQLKQLDSNQATVQGGRAFVCWNPQGYSVPRPTLPLLMHSSSEGGIPKYEDYRKELWRKLAGYRDNWTPSAQVVIAALDAATTGRLAITYYNELLGSDFLERLAHWDEGCCWDDYYRGIISPSLKSIIAYAFGTQRDAEGKVEADEKIIAPQMQRLLACRIDQAAFPLDIMRAIVARAERLLNYNAFNRNALLFTACAVIRKYYIDHQKEALGLELEAGRRDRSYQWGRMLAVMEKIERDTYESGEKRETNAIRMQAVFVRRPAYAFRIVMEQLKAAYYPRLFPGKRSYYEKLIEEIMAQLALDMEDYAKPLGETYLMGYYLQKSALYTKNDESETEVNDDEV